MAAQIIFIIAVSSTHRQMTMLRYKVIIPSASLMAPFGVPRRKGIIADG
jgi:hypothetical protein